MGIAKLNLSVGGAFYTRPVIADGRVVKGLLVVVQTYCPEKVPDVQEFAGQPAVRERDSPLKLTSGMPHGRRRLEGD